MAASPSPRHAAGVPDLDATLCEMQRVQSRVRAGHHHVTRSSLKDPQRELETSGKALAHIRASLQGISDPTIQRDLRILERDYSCLVNRVKVAARLFPSSSTSSSSHSAPSCSSGGVVKDKKEKMTACISTTLCAPVGERYLKFATPETVLKAASPDKCGSVRELYEELERRGWRSSLKYELGTDSSGQPILRFQHSGRELRQLFLKHALMSFYWTGTDMCFFRAYGPPQVSEKGLTEPRDVKKAQVNKLIAEAEAYFDSIIPPEPAAFPIREEALASDRLILDEIYNRLGFEGACLGEWHSDKSARKFLFDNLELLKEFGVTTVFLESCFYDTLQPYLDQYFESSSLDMPLIVDAYLNDHESPAFFADFVRKAKRLNIRVVGIDTSLAFEIENGDTREEAGERIMTMNFVAKKIIDHEKGRGKYIALMGGAHAPTMLVKKGKMNLAGDVAIPGLADLLQCPYIGFCDTDDGSSLALPNVVDYTSSYGKRKHMHLYLKRPAS